MSNCKRCKKPITWGDLPREFGRMQQDDGYCQECRQKREEVARNIPARTFAIADHVSVETLPRGLVEELVDVLDWYANCTIDDGGKRATATLAKLIAERAK